MGDSNREALKKVGPKESIRTTDVHDEAPERLARALKARAPPRQEAALRIE
jgi:hypothetical protein